MNTYFYVADREGCVYGQCLGEEEAAALVEHLAHDGHSVSVFPHPVGREAENYSIHDPCRELARDFRRATEKF